MKGLIMIALAFFTLVSAFSQTITYTYDNIGRITGAEYPDGSSITYTYDAGGNRSSLLSTNPCSEFPVPEISTSAALNICPSDSLTLTASVGDSYMWSTGDTTKSIIIKIAGEYAVTVTAGSCSTTSDTVTVTVTEPTSSTLVVQICSGDLHTLPDGSMVSISGSYPVTLASSNGCDSVVTTNLTVLEILTSLIDAEICSNAEYTLPDGNTISASGSYPITLISSNGCDSIVTINLTVLEILTSSVSAEICAGSSYTLSDGSIVSVSGTYPVTLISSNGCDSVVTTNLTVWPLPEKPQVERDGNNLISSYTTGNQWFYNGILVANAINQEMSLLGSGIYTVQYTDPKGCISMSDDFEVVSVSIWENPADMEDFRVYPNPNEGFFIIEIEFVKGDDGILEFVNSIGQIIETHQLKNLYGKLTMQANLSRYGRGVYFINLRYGQEVFNKQVVVQ